MVWNSYPNGMFIPTFIKTRKPTSPNSAHGSAAPSFNKPASRKLASRRTARTVPDLPRPGQVRPTQAPAGYVFAGERNVPGDPLAILMDRHCSGAPRGMLCRPAGGCLGGAALRAVRRAPSTELGDGSLGAAWANHRVCGRLDDATAVDGPLGRALPCPANA